MSHVKFISKLNLFYIKEYLITRYCHMRHSYHCKERERITENCFKKKGIKGLMVCKL